jgi:hypothetical protein
LVGKPEGKRPPGKPRLMLENNIKMDVTEMGWGSMVLIHPGQDKDQWRALVNKVMNFRKILRTSAAGRFSRSAHVRGVSLV